MRWIFLSVTFTLNVLSASGNTFFFKFPLSFSCTSHTLHTPRESALQRRVPAQHTIHSFTLSCWRSSFAFDCSCSLSFVFLFSVCLRVRFPANTHSRFSRKRGICGLAGSSRQKGGGVQCAVVLFCCFVLLFCFVVLWRRARFESFPRSECVKPASNHRFAVKVCFDSEQF